MEIDTTQNGEYLKVRAVQVEPEHIRLTPCLKALVFQNIERSTTVFSSHSFQTSTTFTPTSRRCCSP